MAERARLGEGRERLSGVGAGAPGGGGLSSGAFLIFFFCRVYMLFRCFGVLLNSKNKLKIFIKKNTES